MRMRLLKFLLLLTITTPLLSKAEEVVVSGAYLPKPYLNLKYEQEFDFDFCIKNATLCKKIEQDQKGGCYADGGNTRIWWDETAAQEQKETDAQKFVTFLNARKKVGRFSFFRGFEKC